MFPKPTIRKPPHFRGQLGASDWNKILDLYDDVRLTPAALEDTDGTLPLPSDSLQRPRTARPARLLRRSLRRLHPRSTLPLTDLRPQAIGPRTQGPPRALRAKTAANPAPPGTPAGVRIPRVDYALLTSTDPLPPPESVAATLEPVMITKNYITRLTDDDIQHRRLWVYRYMHRLVGGDDQLQTLPPVDVWARAIELIDLFFLGGTVARMKRDLGIEVPVYYEYMERRATAWVENEPLDKIRDGRVVDLAFGKRRPLKINNNPAVFGLLSGPYAPCFTPLMCLLMVLEHECVHLLQPEIENADGSAEEHEERYHGHSPWFRDVITNIYRHNAFVVSNVVARGALPPPVTELVPGQLVAVPHHRRPRRIVQRIGQMVKHVKADSDDSDADDDSDWEHMYTVRPLV